MIFQTLTVAGLGGIIAMAMVAGLAWLNRSRPELPGEVEERRIRPGVLTYFCLTLLFSTFAAGAGYLAYYGYMTFRMTMFYWSAAGCAVGVFFVLWGLQSLRRAYDVVWDEDGLEGPCSYWPPVFGRGRLRMGFDEIVDAGSDWGDSYAVWNSAGQRIVWSYLYKDFDRLNLTIAEARPDLFPQFWDYDDDYDDF